MGWHSKGQDDPLGSPGSTLDTRLKKLLLVLNTGTEANPDQTAKDMNDTFRDATRVLCHSAIYNVQYNKDQRTPSKADVSALNFTADTKMEPISVGSTAIDGIISFLVSRILCSEGYY